MMMKPKAPAESTLLIFTTAPRFGNQNECRFCKSKLLTFSLWITACKSIRDS
jgi:hypothetical protein